MFVFGSIFIIWGIITLTKSDGMGAVMLVFGSIGLYNVYLNFNNYKGEETHRNYRLFIHIGRMVGGFTVTVTAVLVVNAQYNTANNSRSSLLASSYPSLYSIKYLLD
jgi:hypothetical protein